MILLRSENRENCEMPIGKIPKQVSSLCVPVQADFEQQVACPLLLSFQVLSGEKQLYYFPHQTHMAAARNQCIALLHMSLIN